MKIRNSSLFFIITYLLSLLICVSSMNWDGLHNVLQNSRNENKLQSIYQCEKDSRPNLINRFQGAIEQVNNNTHR